MTTKNFWGYDKDENGKLVINEEQAEVVRTIFKMYDNGYGPSEIIRYLETNNIPTITGKKEWNASTIVGILKNEKYKGDLLLQKTFTADFLTHKEVCR